jgi:hypothetical protein
MMSFTSQVADFERGKIASLQSLLNEFFNGIGNSGRKNAFLNLKYAI